MPAKPTGFANRKLTPLKPTFGIEEWLLPILKSEGERRMLKVDQYDYIRTAHRIYRKIKQIARETGHSRNTIKKVLRGEYSVYKPRDQQPYPVLGPYLKIINKWLEDDKERPKKQRHTAVRVYNRLIQEH